MQLDEYTAGKRNHKYMKKIGILEPLVSLRLIMENSLVAGLVL